MGEAGRICAQANRRFAQVELVEPSADRAEVALTEVVEIGAAALRDLRRVKPTKGDEADVSAWLGTLEQALDEVDYARALLRAGDVVLAIAAIERADVLTARARALARSFGVERACRVPELITGS